MMCYTVVYYGAKLALSGKYPRKSLNLYVHILSTTRLRLSLHDPTDGFYQGTRFDRSGVFDSILLDGIEMAGRWFERYDPLMHDAVCGPAEEFTVADGLEDGLMLKIGVGLLRPDTLPYDRFRLYEVADGGEWTVEKTDECRVRFCHELSDFYTYVKEIVLTGETSFEIRHKLEAARPISTEVYNHNFFTFGKETVGESRRVDLPFAPVGPGGMQYALGVSDGPLGVRISGDVPVVRTLFWANTRVACLEPYNKVKAAPGEPFSWTLNYQLSNNQ